ncbi:MAG: tetratricopeptide repeat protein [Bryobacterales bacterium]|nr:tetratricopeptide repeat protein [Bryobacterales bacterium]
MKQKIDNADTIFNSGGTKPDRSSPNPCTWSLADLDSLAAKFPKDYRTALLRGSYLNFFTTFDEKYYADALREYQKAALLNPQSPLPHYFIGHLYTRASFWTKAAWASDEGRDEPQRKAILAYDKAIQLDPRFLPAYELRASAYHNLKQYRKAIRDYDKVLELDPENVTAYADRGLAKMEVGQFLSATVDLGDAIRRKKADDHSLTYSHEHRGDAYASLGMYRNAIADYSQALKDQLANLTFLLNLKQIRGLYPEYDGVPDDTMVRKINALFWPEYDHSVMAKQLLEGEGKWPITLVNDLYEKRGDAYLKSGDFRRGVLDFNRIFHGIPNFADTVERWRSLGSGKENWYLDVKSVEFGSTSRLWIKTARKDKTYTIAAYEIDCKGRRLNSSSSATYDQQDQLVNSSEASSGWLRIIPETIGETLYNGACSTAGSSR